MKKFFNIATILYVEDEEDVRLETSKALDKYAKKLYLAKDGEEGLSLYKKYRPDIVITDIRMPKINGIDMSKAIKEICKDQYIIITSAHTENAYFMEAIELQLSGYILKPIDKNLLKNKIVEIVKNILKDKELDKIKILMQEIASFQNNMLIVYDNFNNIIFANITLLNFFAIKDIKEFKIRYDCIKNTFIQHKDFYFDKTYNTKHWTNEIENSKEAKIVSILDVNNDTPKAFLVKIQTANLTKHKICTFTEMTTIITEKEELKIKAFTDELTNISNRAKFNHVVDYEIERFIRYKNDLSLIMFDIDDFKNINDTYGHSTGDKILIDLVTLVKSHIRNTDLFARWGGEEFMILLPNTNLKYSIVLAKNIKSFIQKQKFINNLKITCSFGVTQINKNENREIILKKVDKAMYKAKRNGKNRVESETIYTDNI